MYHCSICNEPNLGTGWFCRNCIEEYDLRGKALTSLPEWIRFCVSNEGKERHRIKTEQEFEVFRYGLIEDLTQEVI